MDTGYPIVDVEHLTAVYPNVHMFHPEKFEFLSAQNTETIDIGGGREVIRRGDNMLAITEPRRQLQNSVSVKQGFDLAELTSEGSFELVSNGEKYWYPPGTHYFPDCILGFSTVLLSTSTQPVYVRHFMLQLPEHECFCQSNLTIVLPRLRSVDDNSRIVFAVTGLIGCADDTPDLMCQTYTQSYKVEPRYIDDPLYLTGTLTAHQVDTIRNDPHFGEYFSDWTRDIVYFTYPPCINVVIETAKVDQAQKWIKETYPEANLQHGGYKKIIDPAETPEMRRQRAINLMNREVNLYKSSIERGMFTPYGLDKSRLA